MDATGGGGGGGQTTSSSASSSNDAEARHAPYLRRSIELAAAARARGDHPFGALLFDPATGEVVAEGMNSVLTQRDCTGHAETNLVREASRTLAPEVLRRCILYTSTQPCPMCAGAIYWSGCGHVVYALPEAELRKLAGEPTFSLPCEQVFASGSLGVEVEGPFFVDEARAVHEGFWDGHVNGPRRGQEEG